MNSLIYFEVTLKSIKHPYFYDWKTIDKNLFFHKRIKIICNYADISLQHVNTGRY